MVVTRVFEDAGGELAMTGGGDEKPLPWRRRCGGRGASGRSASESPWLQERGAHDLDGGGGRCRPKSRRRRFTELGEEEAVLPQRCSKLKLNTQEYSVEYCDHEGQIFVEYGSPVRFKGCGAVATGREDEEVVPAI